MQETIVSVAWFRFKTRRWATVKGFAEILLLFVRSLIEGMLKLSAACMWGFVPCESALVSTEPHSDVTLYNRNTYGRWSLFALPSSGS